MSEKHNSHKYQTSQSQHAYPSSSSKAAQPYYSAHYQQQMQQYPQYQQQMQQHPQYQQPYPKYQQMPPQQYYPPYQQQMPVYQHYSPYQQHQQQMPWYPQYQQMQQYPPYQQMQQHPQYQQPYQIPMQPQQQGQGNQLPMEQSYIENILRMNYGKTATVYMTFEENEEWNAKVFTGRIEAAGRDHIILSDQDTGKRYLLLMVYLDYVTFTEELNYQYPYGSRSSQNTQGSARET